MDGPSHLVQRGGAWAGSQPTHRRPVNQSLHHGPLQCGFNFNVLIKWLISLFYVLKSELRLIMTKNCVREGHWTCGSGKCKSGKCRSDKVWKAISRKYSKVPDELWLSWLSCLLAAKRNSQARRPVDVSTEKKSPLLLFVPSSVSGCWFHFAQALLISVCVNWAWWTHSGTTLACRTCSGVFCLFRSCRSTR